MRKVAALVSVAAGLASVSPAAAAVILVQANANSSANGPLAGAAAGGVTLGQALTVSVDPTDFWSAGAFPRWSDANGLNRSINVAASYTDPTGDSVPAGEVGIDFGTYSFGGLNAPFGALVGLIGTEYRLLGASFIGTAWGTGALSLFYWDSNAGDNIGSINANVTIGDTPVSEPATLAVFGLGLVGLVHLKRRRR
jgi:hypothetical protein